MKTTIILSSSLDGDAGDTARNCAMVLGPARASTFTIETEALAPFDFAVSCIAMDGSFVADEVFQFAEREAGWLQDRLVGIICCSADENEGIAMIDSFSRACSANNPITQVVSLPPHLDDVISFAMQVKNHVKQQGILAPVELVKQELDAFLKSHNTCTLCTAARGMVRGTPIEYFMNGSNMYFLSEGGEKFANILLNPVVSISIYDSYQGMGKLAGVQIAGTASIVSPTSEEYNAVISARGLTNRLAGLPFVMNLIRVTLGHAEFLYSKFTRMAFDAWQTYDFNA
ncbi:MAG TPA: pyridoxamine 5'-phosphate oxidase family protein [Candidatus Lokiarchaeia archaeon]|nr:pyridoxamine 5'-phosphate oxidase family protein [Candidatus Lokiarchaeia archaeon]